MHLPRRHSPPCFRTHTHAVPFHSGALVKLSPSGESSLCAVNTLDLLTQASGTASGPLFRLSGETMLKQQRLNVLIKTLAARSEIQPDTCKYSSHSFRIGTVSAAASRLKHQQHRSHLRKKLLIVLHQDNRKVPIKHSPGKPDPTTWSRPLHYLGPLSASGWNPGPSLMPNSSRPALYSRPVTCLARTAATSSAHASCTQANGTRACHLAGYGACPWERRVRPKQ